MNRKRKLSFIELPLNPKKTKLLEEQTDCIVKVVQRQEQRLMRMEELFRYIDSRLKRLEDDLARREQHQFRYLT